MVQYVLSNNNGVIQSTILLGKCTSINGKRRGGEGEQGKIVIWVNRELGLLVFKAPLQFCLMFCCSFESENGKKARKKEKAIKCNENNGIFNEGKH